MEQRHLSIESILNKMTSQEEKNIFFNLLN